MRKFSRPNSHLFEELLTSKQTRRFNEFEKLKKEKLWEIYNINFIPKKPLITSKFYRNRFGRFLLANTFENRSILVQRKEVSNIDINSRLNAEILIIFFVDKAQD